MNPRNWLRFQKKTHQLLKANVVGGDDVYDAPVEAIACRVLWKNHALVDGWKMNWMCGEKSAVVRACQMCGAEMIYSMYGEASYTAPVWYVNLEWSTVEHHCRGGCYPR